MRNLTQFIQDHSVTLIVWLVSISCAWGVFSTETRWMDSRIAAIESQKVEQVRWQTEQNSAAIREIQMDSRVVREQLTTLKSRLDVIDNKIDGIVESLKRQEHSTPTGN